MGRLQALRAYRKKGCVGGNKFLHDSHQFLLPRNILSPVGKVFQSFQRGENAAPFVERGHFRITPDSFLIDFRLPVRRLFSAVFFNGFSKRIVVRRNLMQQVQFVAEGEQGDSLARRKLCEFPPERWASGRGPRS
jgi:hypothetical protein